MHEEPSHILDYVPAVPVLSIGEIMSALDNLGAETIRQLRKPRKARDKRRPIHYGLSMAALGLQSR